MKIVHGVATVDGDTHIGKWVEEAGTLRIAQRFLAPFGRYVPRGSVVIDCGANIGDHTVEYAEWVGPEGLVYCFEPNADAFECLAFNTQSMANVVRVPAGLSSGSGWGAIERNPNVGASHLTAGTEFPLMTIDQFDLKNVSFIKMDIEGSEPEAIKGAMRTLIECSPVMLIEFNDGALRRYGSSSRDLKKQIEALRYTVNPVQKIKSWDDPQYDCLCLPRK